MNASELTDRLGPLVDLLRAGKAKNASLADIAAVSEIVIRVLQSYLGSIETAVYRECDSLSKYISEARHEIATVRPEDLKATKIPRAGKELDAIVKATEDATGEIMTAAEEMMAAEADDLESYKVLIETACMRIFEACAFQDITGQRVAKVVHTLDHIEERLGLLQSAWGSVEEETDAGRPGDADTALMTGPALDGEGIDQDAVDALMADGAPPVPVTGEHKSDIQQQIDSLFA